MCEYLRYASTLFRNVSLAKSLEKLIPYTCTADRDCFHSFFVSKEKIIGVRAIFCQGGGAVNHLPKTIFPSCPNFYKTVEQKRGPMQQDRPHWHMKMAPYSFSGSIPAKFEHKLRRHKQSFGKIATTVVLDKDENLL